MLQIPRTSYYKSGGGDRTKFWKSLNWTSSKQFTKNKKNKRKNDKKCFNFGKISWSKMLSIEFYQNVTTSTKNQFTGKTNTSIERKLKSFIYILGGCNF